MPKKPQTEYVGVNSQEQQEKMADMLARKQSAVRQGVDPRNDMEARKAGTHEQFDQQQQALKAAEAKKEAKGIGEQLRAALKSFSPRSRSSSNDRGKGGPGVGM